MRGEQRQVIGRCKWWHHPTPMLLVPAIQWAAFFTLDAAKIAVFDVLTVFFAPNWRLVQVFIARSAIK